MPTDAVIAGCLSRIQRGDVSAVGVLADYLEEHSLPNAKRVRQAWDRVQEWGRIVAERSFEMQARRKQTKWERIASHRRWLRQQVAKLFGRKWKPLPLRRYV